MMTKKTRLTPPSIRQRKKHDVPLVALTAYSAPFARILDSHVDILLVGDSLGMVLYGEQSTLGVRLDVMIRHGKAVADASTHACVVVDMPFASYQPSREIACKNAMRILANTGAAAVKLEGGEEMADTIHYLTQRGVPVMGHVGLMPQHVNAMGGYRYQGKTGESHKQVLKDAAAVAEAGAFAMVLEGVTEVLAAEVTAAVDVLVIGIGASAACDGQILVTEDLLGLTEKTPRFVKRYADLASVITQAVESYAGEVRQRSFPSDEHTYSVPVATTIVKEA